MCNTKFINILLLLVGLFVAVSDETEIPLDSSHWKIVYDGFGQVGTAVIPYANIIFVCRWH